MMAKKKINKLKHTGKLMKPIVKAVINIPTAGIGGALMEAVDVHFNEMRKKNVDNFMHNISKKIDELGLRIDEGEFKKRVQSPEFLQIFMKILNKIQIETRVNIRKAYSNLLVQLTKEDLKINFNQKLFYVEILETLNEEHIKILHIFYKRGDVKDRFLLEELYKQGGCYERRKLRSGDTSSLWGGDMIIALNHLKSSYFEGLLSDLVGRKLIKIETEITSEPDVDKESDVVTSINSIDSKISEEYIGNELGRDFYKFITTYK